MSNHQESLSVDHVAGSVRSEAQFVGNFPFQAFSFTEQGAAQPFITLLSPWRASGLFVAVYAP